MENQPSQSNHFKKFLLFIFFIGFCIFIGRYTNFDLDTFRSFFAGFPIIISGCIFVIAYVVITTFVWVGPKDIFRISSAILFGPIISTIFVTIAESFNACILFTISRRLGQDFVAEKLHYKPGKIDKDKKNTGFIWVLALRLNPLVPFRMTDIAFGLSRISLAKYLTAACLAMPLRVLWLQFIIAGVGESLFEGVHVLVDYLQTNQQLLIYSMVYFILVGVLTVIALVMNLIKKEKSA